MNTVLRGIMFLSQQKKNSRVVSIYTQQVSSTAVMDLNKYERQPILHHWTSVKALDGQAKQASY